MNKIFAIYRKEMMEVLRDRKTLVFMIVLPTIVLPVLFNALYGFIEKKNAEARTEILKVAILNGDLLPHLAERFEESERFQVVAGMSDVGDFKTAIQQGDLKVGLVFPPDAPDLLACKLQLKIETYYNNALLTSRAVQRTQTVIDAYNDDVRKARLGELGLTSSLERDAVVDPVVLKKLGIAEEREIWGERVGGMLPYLFIAFCFLGALYPAIDIAAGEKERGTLETLLLTPVRRSSLVLGKFLVVFTSGMTSSILCVISMAVWVGLKGKNAAGELARMMGAMQPVDFVMMGVILVPMAAVFACILLSLSIYAKNFKEAQSYIAPMQLLCILPAVIAMLPGVELNWKWAMVPVTNIALAIKELVKGTMDFGIVAMIFASTSVVALAALAFCVRWFQREEVLFRN